MKISLTAFLLLFAMIAQAENASLASLSCKSQVESLENAQSSVGSSNISNQDLLLGALDQMLDPTKKVATLGSTKDSIAYARYIAYFSCVNNGVATQTISQKFFSGINRKDPESEEKVGAKIAELISRDEKLKGLDCRSYLESSQKRLIPTVPIYNLCCSLKGCMNRFVSKSVKSKSGVE